MSKKPKHLPRAEPQAFFSKTPWAGFARGDAPRASALSRCPDARCRRAKDCLAAHQNLFCQRTHFSSAEKQKFDLSAQRAFEKKFPAYPEETPFELRQDRLQSIIAYRKSEQQELFARWKAGAFDGLYGKWSSRGALMKPPPRVYKEE